MTMWKTAVAVIAFAPMSVLAGCSFSASVGGLDYDKLEKQISDQLDTAYTSINQKVTSVDCPEQAKTPKTGDTFVCKAKVADDEVRVQVDVKDDKGNVEYTTMDKVFDLPSLATGLASEITKQQGFEVTVDCGQGLKVVATGKTLECSATDPQGEVRTVEVTAGAGADDDSWKVLDQ